MYIALLIMFAGILAGRFLQGMLNPGMLKKMTFAAILLLLFILGAQIGMNEQLFLALPRLGWQALILALGCVSGSVLVVWLIFAKFCRHEV